MRKGDTLSLGAISTTYNAPLPNDEKNEFTAYAQAHIKKEGKGQYYFTGLWTIPTKESRADIWAYGHFTVNKGMITLSPQTTPEALRSFFLVCRYIERLIDSDRDDRYPYNQNLNPIDDWFYVNSIPFHFDGFWFDKNQRSTELRVMRYKVEDGKTTKTERCRLSYLQIDGELLTHICQQPLLALFEKAMSSGTVALQKEASQ